MPTPTALVTGGSRGLGRDMALRLADDGRDVVLTYRSNADAAAEVADLIRAKGRRAAALRLDVAAFDAYDDFVERLRETLAADLDGAPGVDYLVNNAGISLQSLIGQTAEADFDRVFDVHVKSVYLLTQRLLGLLRDGGAIVNVSTGLARFTIPSYAAYASAKAAVEGLTRYLAKELGGRGIRANVVAPGPIDTDFNADAFASNPGMRRQLSDNTALGRVGRAEDIGGVVAFLCSDDARWVTAQRLEASGGTLL